MAKSKKPRKPYRPTWNVGGIKLRAEPWKVEATFRPVENILDELERDGTVNCEPDGTPIFKDTGDGDWYNIVPSLEGFICAFEIHEGRAKRPMHLEPLRRLANKLQYSMPIMECDVAAARATLAGLRAEANEMRAEYAADIVRSAQLRIAMDAQKVAA